MARVTLKSLLPQPPVVFSWDLDKTYLKSEFDSLRELVRIPFEKPEDKIAVPGVIPLIRNLKRVAKDGGREARVYFISASPPQIAKAIKEKLSLDGVDYDGIIFKNQLGHLVRGRFRNLREQVGYKLTELLRARPAFAADTREVLFGDDWESDPIIYSLYADVLAGRVAQADLRGILQVVGVHPNLIDEAEHLTKPLSTIDAVERIYINLERRTPPALFRVFGPRLVPTFNYFQTACCLYQDGYFDLAAVAEVAEHLLEHSQYTHRRLTNSLADIERRAHLSAGTVRQILDYLEADNLLTKPGTPRRSQQSWWRRVQAWIKQRFAQLPTPNIIAPADIDYRELIQQWRNVAIK